MRPIHDPELDRPIYEETVETLIPLGPAQEKYQAVQRQLKGERLQRILEVGELLQLLTMRIEGRTTGTASPAEELAFTKHGLTVPTPCK